jgi:hypothetical protein
VQPLNALSPILVIVFGIVTLIIVARDENAFAAMLLTVYVKLFTTKLDTKVTAADADELTATLAAATPTV